MTTSVPADLVKMSTGRSLEDHLMDLVNAADYGATTGGSALTNTDAINDAIVAATGTSGFVIVGPGISYTEGDLVIPNGVVVIIYSSDGTITYLVKDQGATLPVTKGGIILKSQGHTGILLRAVDNGVSAEPVIQIVDASNGDIAATETKLVELNEITDPTAPSSNKAKLYIKDNGSGSSQLAVRFASGSVIPLCTQSQDSNLTGSATWDPASIANNAIEEKDVTVVGAVVGDFVIASFSNDLQGLTISAHISAADTASVVLHNSTGGAKDLASGTVKVLVIRNW